MRFFLDTEFTNLDSPKLISIGIVSEDSKGFYRKLTNGCTLADCSLFALGWVLPLLSDSKTYDLLHSSLKNYMELHHALDDARSLRLGYLQEVQC